MRFILSRKGYDSQFGGSPSPVFRSKDQNFDGLMYSIPIPECDSKGNSFDFGLPAPQTPVGFPVNTRYFHLDPDIRPELHHEPHIKRPNEWKPILGQSGAAASHLKAQHVQSGDIFLFFGLFQDVEWNENNKQWLFGNSKPYHAIWGYMQIAEIINTIDSKIQEQYKWHPHCKSYYLNDKNNTLYIGNEGKLTIRIGNEWKQMISDTVLNDQGYGAFKYGDKLRLTLPQAPHVTQWKLDCLPWLDAKKKETHMSYHNDEDSFQHEFFKAATRGQEFVTDDFENESELGKKVFDWFKDLVTLRTSFPEKQLQ